jgi:hypothetical protein
MAAVPECDSIPLADSTNIVDTRVTPYFLGSPAGSGLTTTCTHVRFGKSSFKSLMTGFRVWHGAHVGEEKT